jgi:methionyl-tRNA synthetase
MTNKIRLVRPAPNAATLSLLMLCFCFGSRIVAQAQTLSTVPGQGPRNPAETEMEAQQKRAAEKVENAKRQQDIQKDTDKLLQLATELKQYVDKTDEHTLSVAVIKKAEEIEKLAHAVKEKMKGQ